MLYGNSRNIGHGWRRPSYGWTPSFSPRRPKRRKGRGGSRRASCRREPSLTLAELLLAYPTANPASLAYRSQATLDLDLSRNLQYLAARVVAALVPFLFVYWQFSLAFGVGALVVRHFLRRTRGLRKSFEDSCGQASPAHRVSRKASLNPPPTAVALESTWVAAHGARRGDSDALAARLRLGTMLSDLEPIVDQSYIRDENGTIVGRRPGLRGWIAANVPALLPHYKSLMAYKALADKLRIALGVEEPDTLDAVLDLSPKHATISVDSPETEDGKAEDQGGDGGPSERSKISVEGLQIKEECAVDGTGGDCALARSKISVDESGEMGEDGKGRAPKSWLLNSFDRMLKSNAEMVRDLYKEMFGRGFPETMVELEVMVRGQLGQAWMRRQRKRAFTA